jgi:hypothetical protein
MLSLIPGVNGVPLSYVIRKVETPEPGEKYGTFTEECVARAPLKGAAFEADSRQAHQLILALVQGEVAEQWIKPFKKAKDGRKDMMALVAHHEGEGNSSRRISDAERLKTNLIYKSEKSSKFQVFLSNCQKMFNIFDLEEETMSEDAKLRFLFERVQHPELKSAVSALQVKFGMGDKVSFTSAANHLAAQLATTDDYRSNADRRVGISAVQGDSKGANAPTDGITKNGKIYTGFYPNFYDLSKENKRAVYDERKARGEKSPGKKGSGSGNRAGGGKRNVSAAKQTEMEKELGDLRSQVGNMKHQVKQKVIAALKRQQPDSDSSEEEEAKDDAGTGFGGRAAKKSVKFGKGTKRGKKKE